MTVAERERPTDPVRIEDVLPDLDDGVDLDRLDTEVAANDLDVGILTDEELHWLADRDEVSDDDLEAPRLGAMPPAERRAAAEGALWVLLARGDLETDDGQIRAVGRHGLVATLREDPLGVARIHVAPREGEAVTAALYHITPAAVLVEDVSPVGLHHFVITTPERAAAVLLDLVAPDEVTGDTAQAQRATRIADLADLDALVGRAQTSAQVFTGRAADGEVAQTASTVYQAGGELHVLSGWADENEDVGEVALQRLGYEDAVAWAIWVVTQAIRPPVG